MEWFCVTSSFSDKGLIVANVTDSCVSESKPEGTYRKLRNKDVYNDWFPSRAEAERFANETRKA